VLRRCGCDIVVLNAHVQIEDTSGDSKDSFYGELEQEFGHFPKYQKRVLLTLQRGVTSAVRVAKSPPVVE
jgi:hypothetical protein